MSKHYITQICACLAVAAAASVHAEETLEDCVINPRSTIELGSYQDGILRDVLVSRGDRVAKGQPVARLDDDLERMTAELAQIRADSDIEVRSSQLQAAFRDREEQRLEALKSNQSVSQSMYEQAEIESNLATLSVDAARVEHRVAQAEYQRALAHYKRRTITSPVDGLVVDISMSPGEYVHEQSTLMTIAEVTPLYVEVFLPVSEYGTVSEGMQAEVRPEEPIGGTYQAEVKVVDRVFDAASRTFGVRLEIPNADLGLPAGVRCLVKIDRECNGCEVAAN